MVRVLRPDAEVDTSGVSINPAATAAVVPAVGALATLTDDGLKAVSPWLEQVWNGIKTGPVVSFASTATGNPGQLNVLGPVDPTWAAQLANAAGGSSIGVTPQVQSSPVVAPSAVDPSPMALGKLVSALNVVKQGKLSYSREAGLKISGEADAAQQAALKGIDLGANVKPQYEFGSASAPAMIANTGSFSMSGAVADGVITLSGQVPDAAARESILSKVKESAPGVQIVDNMKETAGIAFPSAALVGTLASQFASAPGSRSFTFTDKALQMKGEVTESLLDSWQPTLKKMAKLGFSSEEPAWEKAASVFHFKSYKAGAGLDDATRAAITQALQLNQIYFDSGSSSIRESEQPKIVALVAALKAAGKPVPLVAGGHADKRGSAASNQRLSAKRVASVIAGLKAGGVDATTISPESFGASEAAGDDEASLAACRRVELLLR
jgi:outer membrane protein OmpA-like peptidoglycan-associated protein